MQRLHQFVEPWFLSVASSPWFHKTYLIDYALVIGIFFVDILLRIFVQPFHRIEIDHDTSTQFPLEKETIPNWALIVVSVVCPLIYFLLRLGFFRHLHDFHHSILGFAETISLTTLFTDSIKYSAGRYRPNWGQMSSLPQYVIEGRLSFPSGHTSLSFAAMTFASLYLSGKGHIFTARGGQLWKVLICIVFPQSIAWSIAVSRTRDYWHEFADILGGAMLGSCWAVVCYFLHYPSLLSNDSHLPNTRVDPTVNTLDLELARNEYIDLDETNPSPPARSRLSRNLSIMKSSSNQEEILRTETNKNNPTGFRNYEP